MSTAAKPRRKKKTVRRAGQYAITRITGRPEPGAHDVVTALELLDEFYGMPLTLDDFRAELGWPRERIRAALDLAQERGLIAMAEAPDATGPGPGATLVRRVEEAYPTCTR